MMQTIAAFFKEYVRPIDRLLLWLDLLTIVIGTIFILINVFYTHYTYNFYLPLTWIACTPIIAVIWCIALYARDIAPKTAMFTRTYTTYFFIISALGILTTGIQLTPFPIIDHFLVYVDQLMGFYTIPVLNWTFSHPTLKNVLSVLYDFIGPELLLIPLILAILNDEFSINRYFLILIFSFIIGSIIYYFFPTEGPTAVFSSPHFLSIQRDTSLKFMEVHKHLPVTTSQGGMIAFPSFHVAWAMILTYACIRHRWLFYPLVLVNIFVCASTVLLGWHYLTDVIAGALLFIVSVLVCIAVLKSEARK